MKLVQPPFLKKGDKVAIVSPARSITFEEVHPSIRLFQEWGFEVVLGIYVFSRHHQFAGKDDQRLNDLQQVLDDNSIRAIFCARGGYCTVRILDRLDFTKFRNNPKWITGYSDITILHTHVQKHLGIQTLHSTMLFNIKEDDFESDTIISLKNALFGEQLFYKKRITFRDRTGLSTGIVTGGNISILYSLMGTPTEFETNGKILFLEDVDEYLYHLDRMMMNLKRAGKFKNLKGLIVGSLKDMKDNPIPFGQSAEDIIADAVKEYQFPVCFDFPAGHDSINLALYLGRMATFKVDEEVSLVYG